MAERLRALIVDDEPLARQGMRNRLQQLAHVEIVGECVDGYDAVEQIQDLAPDVVLLDVQMPGLDGFGVISSLEGLPVPAVIFVTAFDEYAIKAFRVHAVDYLVKPVDDAQLGEALAKAQERLDASAHKLSATALSAMARDYQQSAGPAVQPRFLQRIQVRQNTRVIFVKTELVTKIESADNYLRIATPRNAYLVRATMRDIEQRLDPEQFVRIHRQTIVNLNHVREIAINAPGEYVVVMTDDTSHRVGRLYRDALLERGF